MRGPAVVALIVLLCSICCAVVHGVSVSCMMAYDEGGAPAVFASLECPYWLFNCESSQNSTRKCQLATFQGHREYQEDRSTCNLELKLPFSVEGGPEEITVGIAAVFDGHGGVEASELASTKLLYYFPIHAVVTAYKHMLLVNKGSHDSPAIKSSWISAPTVDQISLLHILEAALLKTIHDIDSEFSKEAMENGYVSGSTATIVLLVYDQFLVANVGDSKALLCSQKLLPLPDVKGGLLTEIIAEELTRDHHPGREDEQARIEAAGGYVSKWGVDRVHGVLAVSRAIGDVYFKRYGVTADPEITGWRRLPLEGSHLVVASDGIFETLSPQDVCELIHNKVSDSSSSSLAGWIVRQAFRTGSTDNLSAIVISDLHKYVEDKGGKNTELTI